jgi:hypothetical protein
MEPLRLGIGSRLVLARAASTAAPRCLTEMASPPLRGYTRHQLLSPHLPRHRSHRPSVLPGARSPVSPEALLLQPHRPLPISLRVPATISWIRYSEMISWTPMHHRRTPGRRPLVFLPDRLQMGTSIPTTALTCPNLYRRELGFLSRTPRSASMTS